MSETVGARRRLVGKWLGKRRYEPVHELQLALHQARTSGSITDTVLLLEHEPVITLGRAAKREHLLVTSAYLAAQGVDLAESGRGGDVTLHAPGQLVCYPIVDLSPDRRDVRRYVRGLTGVMQSLVAPLGIATGTIDGLVGVWVDRANPSCFDRISDAAEFAKIGAIGVRISRWVTMHGFALNVTTELGLFGLIVPCGIRQYGVTSVQELTGQRPQLRDLAQNTLTLLGRELDADTEGIEDCSETDLRALFPRTA